jgi:hypothetical protein
MEGMVGVWGVLIWMDIWVWIKFVFEKKWDDLRLSWGS